MTKTIYIIAAILLIWNITPHIILWSLDMAEASKRVKDSDLRDIESAIENLAGEFYQLKEALK